MEIILESDLSVGLSSYSLMRRRNVEGESYLGEKCSYYDNINKKVLNGACGDVFFVIIIKHVICVKKKNAKNVLVKVKMQIVQNAL